jgi:hypothetical protein
MPTIIGRSIPQVPSEFSEEGMRLACGLDVNFAACCWLLERRHPEPFGQLQLRAQGSARDRCIRDSDYFDAGQGLKGHRAHYAFRAT